jgi:hypothetical protein
VFFVSFVISWLAFDTRAALAETARQRLGLGAPAAIAPDIRTKA